MDAEHTARPPGGCTEVAAPELPPGRQQAGSPVLAEREHSCDGRQGVGEKGSEASGPVDHPSRKRGARVEQSARTLSKPQKVLCGDELRRRHRLGKLQQST